MSPELHRIDELRCADQDREVVAQLLNNAYADGRLTFDEHAERISQAYDAKTFGDLNHLTTDLVVQERRPAMQRSQTPPPSTLPASSDEFTGGNAVLSTMRPGRISVIAPEVTVNAWLGEVKLDLVGTAFASRETTINVGGLMCDVKIRVPQGVEVNVSGLTMVMGDSKIDGIVPHPDAIRIRLVGTVIMGEVKVMGPDVSNPRKYEKFVR